MLKRLAALMLTLACLFSFSGIAGAAAYMSPSYQHIKGSTATATWDLSWSGGSGHYVVIFNPDNGSGYKTIDASTKYNNIKGFKYTYSANVNSITYHPRLLVLDYNDGTAVGNATATVYKTRS